MNKKLIKTIASITCGLGIATSVPFIVSSCNKNEDSIELSITYNGQDKAYGKLTKQHSGEKVWDYSKATLSSAGATLGSLEWIFDVKCINYPTERWTDWIEIKFDTASSKIAIHQIKPVPSSDEARNFEFSIQAKKGSNYSNVIDGFTCTVYC